MSAPASASSQRAVKWEPGPDQITLGVDIIELLSSSMYVEPLTTYREYVQNAADAIDDAREIGLNTGRIDITIDPSERTILIRDNGAGLGRDSFVRRLTAFGGSDKRRRQRRGFRGVGRLAGLGYCRELVFRSQGAGEGVVSELRWDGQHLRSILRNPDFVGTLAEAVCESTSHRRYAPENGCVAFFEVEMRGIVRHGRDDLLNSEAVSRYLAEVAPIPFAPAFCYGAILEEFLADKGVRSELEIYVNKKGPLYRPHRDSIQMTNGLASSVQGPEFFEIEGIEGSPAACGWLLHHDYLGVIPRCEGVRGIRLRSGNIQVGDEDVLRELFHEPRFNSWAVGEAHIIDRRITPNGRRDQYEYSTHLANVVNHLTPLARGVASRCRTSSQHRQCLRTADILEERILEHLAVLRQGVITKDARSKHLNGAVVALRDFEKIVRLVGGLPEHCASLKGRQEALTKSVSLMDSRKRAASPLDSLPSQRRRAFEEVFTLLYECAEDRRAADVLIQRVIARLT